MAKEAVKTKTSTELRYPSRFNVVIYNDDFTPVEFVITLLIEIFNKNITSAKTLTQTVHSDGQAVAGTYNSEIAEQKCLEAVAVSRSSGHPLQLKVERIG
jgi:ATP-dependent Clp protease adaptor protein ClpS